MRRAFAGREDEVRALFERGLSPTEIGRELGAGTGVVASELHRQGLRARAPRSKLTPAADRRLRELYDAGTATGELCRLFGISATQIPVSVRRAGGTVRAPGGAIAKRTLSEEEAAQMLTLHRSGKSIEFIRKRLGAGGATIKRLLRERGEELSERTPFVYSHRGYRYVFAKHTDPDLASMRDKRGYIAEHRLVLARKIGRPLLLSETVHHIDGNPSNNAPENLQLRQGRHGKHAVYVCCDCGSRNVKPAPLDEAPKKEPP